jgi:4-amino-4-deoxy-L-arabinose transferase-like glycosyltransferase
VRALWTLGALAVIGLFVGLGDLDWVDDRESRDAAIAHELAFRREKLTPILGGIPQFEKPLLAYAPEVLAAAATPGSPVGTRAMKGALAAALVLLTGAIGARWMGVRVGTLSAAVLATSLALPIAARTDGTQLLATCLGWFAWAGLARAVLGEGKPRGLTLSYLALAVALLVAGPWPALWPLAAVAFHRAVFRVRAPDHAARRPGVQAVAGTLLMLGLALPWYGAMLERHGGAFALELAAFPYGGVPGNPWYAAPARMLGFLVVGFYPWSTLLPAAALYRWTVAGAVDVESVALTRLLIATLAASLVPVAFAPAAPLPSALPALPAAALLVGALLDRAFAREPIAHRAVAQASWLVGGSGTVAAVMLMFVSRRLGEAAPEVRLLAAFLLVAAWAPALAVFIRRTRAVPALLACTVALGTPLVLLRTLPALEGYLTTGPVAAAMNAASAKNAPLLVLESPPASLHLRLERHLSLRSNLARGFRMDRGDDGWAYVAYPPRRESEVARAAAPAPLEILLRTPALVLARVGRP